MVASTEEAECVAVDAGDVAGLVALAEKVKPDLTVVGPELPPGERTGGCLYARNWAVVGPDKKAAQLEGSKDLRERIFCKDTIFRQRNCTVRTIRRERVWGVCAVDWPVVIKADGLCAGKGVFVARIRTRRRILLSG